ncbi:MAG: hypothetical protein QG635_1297 [Bacteroidota bacterium]|nr:hypothetical protein [Bacteroidota bacterium]
MKYFDKFWVCGIKLSIIMIILSAFTVVSNAQFMKKVDIAGGLSTCYILGDNPASLPMLQRDENKPAVQGGGFGIREPGFGLAATFNLDEEGDWRMPVTFDYYIFRSAQRVPVYRTLTALLYNEYDVASLSLGAKYSVLYFPLGNANIYIGAEAKGNIISQSTYKKRHDYQNDALDTMAVYHWKDAAFRIGAAARIGLEGEIWGPWMINTSIAIGAMNLLLRDDSRGELLTPEKYLEDKETIMYNIFFSLLLQYKL